MGPRFDDYFRSTLLSEIIAKLTGDLDSTKKLILKWNAICQTGSVFEKSCFIIFDVRKLKELDLQLYKHNDDINSIIQKLLFHKATNDTNVEQLKKILQQEFGDLGKKIQKAQEQMGGRRKWEEVVNQHGVEAVSQAACDQDNEPWLLLRKELVLKGLSEKEADKILKPMRKELNALHAPKPVLISPKSETPPNNMSSPVIVPIHPKKPENAKKPELAPPSPQPQGNSSGGSHQLYITIGATAKQEAQVIEVDQSRILFVDESNTRKCLDRPSISLR